MDTWLAVNAELIGITIGVCLAVLALVKGMRFLLTAAAVVLGIGILLQAAPWLWETVQVYAGGLR